MRFTKKLLIAFTLMITSVLLIACGDDPVDDTTLADALSSLNVSYVSGDTAANVTGNLTLPTTIGEVAITWVSSNTAVISNAGVVTRPAVGQADANVTLTATLAYDEETETKVFTLVVKALVLTDQQKADAAKDLLDITLATGDTLTSVTRDIVLPATAGDAAVTWVSGSSSVISNAGVVTRPAAGLANADVVLFATLTVGTASATKQFSVTVVAQPILETDQDIVEEAALTLGIGFAPADNASSVKSDLSLPFFAGEVFISWVSSNTAVISNVGSVDRPAEGEADVVVTLTATLVKGDGETEKVFTVTVKAIPVNNAPVFSGVDPLSLFFGQEFTALSGVTANDPEDGDLTSLIVVKLNNVNVQDAGSYLIIYQVADSLGKVTEVIRVVEVVNPVNPLDYQPANYLSGVDLSKLPASEKGILFSAAERYLLENVYAGVPLYTRATRVMYSDRVQLFSPTYNGVMGFGTGFSQFSSDDSTVRMYEETFGQAGQYTWRASYNTDPTTLNPWIADDSATSDFIDMFSGGLYDFYFDSTKTGYEINPSLALSDPIPVNPTEINGKLYAKVWQIPLRDNLVWKFHPNTNVSGLPAGYDELDASDYLWTWKYALDNSWFRAYTGGGDFVSQGIKGVADYLDGIVTWDSVGLRMAEGETNVLELEYINEKSEFEIKYGFAGGVLTPINQELFEALGGEDFYGVDPITVASSGVYYFDQWTDGQLLTFKKNTNHPQSNMYHYTGYQYRYINGSDNIFAEFLAGRLESASVPASQVDTYASDPRVKTAPDATTWRLMINGFGTEAVRDAYIAENPSVGISETFVPEPILSYLPMRQALYYGFDRYYAAIELVKLYLPAHTLFAQTYFLDGESGLSVRGTAEGMAIVTDFGGNSNGYFPDAAEDLFKDAVAQAIADGFYTAGTASDYNTIQLVLTYASSGNTSAQMMVANIEEQYEDVLVDDVNFVNIDIVINDVAFPNNYYDYMMVANTDLGIGGISGSLLDAPSFLDVFADDNRGGFTLNWGIDTSSVNIPVSYTNLDGNQVYEMWSYNALVEALNGKVYVKAGAEQVAWTDPVDLVDAYLDMSGEVRESLSDGDELASYIVGDLAELATSLNVDSVEAHIVVTVSGKNFLFILTKDGTQFSLYQQMGLDTTAEDAIQNYIYANYGNYELLGSVGPLTDAEIEANAYIAGSYGYLTVAEVAADLDAPVAFTEVYATTWDGWEDAVVVLHIGDYFIGWAWL